MARGTQLGDLIEMFRNEARQSNQLSVGTDSLPHVKQVIARTQRLLYAKHYWPFLRVISSIDLQAGSQFYTPPENLNIDRIVDVVVKYNGEPIPVDRGIGFDEYAQYDPEDDERSSPVLKWDLAWDDTATSVEVWPLPDNNDMRLMFKCMRPLNPLVDNTDRADLDDDLIVLFAVAEELAAQKAKDADLKLKLAQGHLSSLLENAQSGAPMIQVGLGKPAGRGDRAVVRVS